MRNDIPMDQARQNGSNLGLALGLGFVLIASMMLLGWFALADRGAAPLTDRRAPEFRATLVGGQEVRLSDYRGKVVLLNIWATWCKPCEEEAPSLERLYKNLKAGPAGDDFEILAVSIDARSRDAVLPFQKKFSLTFPILFDPDGRVSRLYQTTGVPESFVIDRAGIIREKVIGPRTWDSEEMLAWFKEMLARKTDANAS